MARRKTAALIVLTPDKANDMKKHSATKLSLAEMVIAELLRQSAEPLFGLELVRRSPPGDLQLKKGSIYVMLERMEKKGLVVSELEKEKPADIEEGRFYIPRRMYRLTPQGQNALIASKTMLNDYKTFLLGA